MCLVCTCQSLKQTSLAKEPAANVIKVGRKTRIRIVMTSYFVIPGLRLRRRNIISYFKLHYPSFSRKGYSVMDWEISKSSAYKKVLTPNQAVIANTFCLLHDCMLYE